MTKAYRQSLILDIIQRERVHTQEQLAERLRGRGLEATQVTLSRDIRELGLAKGPAGYQQIRAEAVRTESLSSVLQGHLYAVRAAQNQVVLRTSAGHAQPIALALDREEWDDVVGTVAGDDTILVIAPDNASAGRVAERLLDLIR
jgi:transcriptional regulator of arginine metabolism